MSKTLKNIIYVFGAAILSKFIGIFTSFFIPRILEPDNYGIWITLLLIISYSGLATFGSLEALLKQFPYYIGRGDMIKAREVENGVLGSIILSATLLLIAGLSFNFFFKIETLQSSLSMIRIMIIAASVGLLSAFFHWRFAAHQNFKMYSMLDTIHSIFNFIVLVIFTWLWGLKGTVFGYCLIQIILCILSFFLSNSICGKVGVNFNHKLIWEMVKIGLPITIIWWTYILQTTAGTVISISMLGKTEAGYYGLGGSIISILILIPMAIGQVLYPKVSEGLGKNLEKKDMALLVITPARVLSLILPIAIIVLILISPIIYHIVFPKYVRGLLSAQILLLGAFFICLVRTGANYLIANGEQNQLIKFVLISLITVIAANITFVKLGLNIEGIALGSAFSGALFTTLIWKTVFKSFGYDRLGQLKEIFNLYAPFLLLIGLIGVFVLVFPGLLTHTSLVQVIYVVAFILSFSLIILFIPPFSKTSREIYALIKANIPGKLNHTF